MYGFFLVFFFLLFFFCTAEHLYEHFQVLQSASGTCKSSEENMQVMMDGSQRPRNETFAAPKKQSKNSFIFLILDPNC